MIDLVGFTAAVVGITTAAIGSVKFLYITIGDIKDVPTALENIRSDLQAVEPVLQNLIINLERKDSQLLLTDAIKGAVENCNIACSTFKERLDHWMRYATKYKAFWVEWTDRARVGIFEQGTINVFKGRLNDCKSTLNVALSTSSVLTVARQESVMKEVKDSMLKGNEEFLNREKDRGDRELATIESSLKQLSVSIRDEVNEESKRNLEQLLKEMQEEKASNEFFRKTCEEALLKTQNIHNGIQQEIKNTKADNNSKALEPSSTVPFRRDPDFVDRDILTEIEEKCLQPASRAALVGLGGVGKSQLAIECSYRVREKSPQTWVFWVYASNATRFEKSYRTIASRIKLPHRNEPKADILRLVNDWLSNEANGRWLLILDNADDAAVLFDVGEGKLETNTKDSTHVWTPLSAFLPQTPNGSVLVTSRNREAVSRVIGRTQDIITVESMSERQAIELFSKKDPGGFDDGAARKLLQTLDYMPLAISQAAAYISQRAPRITVTKYLEMCRKSDKSKISLLNRDERDNRRDREAINSVSMTWQISFDHICRQRSSAARLLSLMSLFDRQEIPVSLLRYQYEENEDEKREEKENKEEYEDEDENENDDDDDAMDFEEDVSMLRNYSLVRTTDNDGDLFEMHQLVQLSTRRWLESHRESERWEKKYILNMLEAFPSGEYENWTICQALFPHAQRVLAYRPKGDEYIRYWTAVLSNAGWYARIKGEYSTAEEMNRQALKAREKILGVEHPETLASVHNLALVLRDQGKYEAAEELHRRGLEGKEKVLGVEHPDTLTSVDNLALVLRKQGNYEAAEELHRRGLEGKEKVLGVEHPETLASVHNLAEVFRKQGKYEAAEKLHRRALEGKEKVLGVEHPDTLTSVSNLALVLQEQGKYKAAKELHRRALEGSEKVLGVEHPHTLASVNNLALVLRYQGKYKAAGELHRRALEGSEKVLGAEHPDTLASVDNLALVLRYQGKYRAAEELHRRALEGSEKVLGVEHPHTLISVSNLALVLQEQGKYEAAKELHRRALEGSEKVLGAEHPETLASVDNLALVLRYQGKYEEAVEGTQGDTKVDGNHSASASAGMLSDVESDASSEGGSIFSALPTTMSSKSSLVSSLAMDEFISLLLTDDLLKPIFEAAVEYDRRISPKRFGIDFGRLLNQFSVDLKLEAQNITHERVVCLVRSRSRYIANSCRHRLVHRKEDKKTYSMLKTQSNGEVKGITVDRFLNGLASAEMTTPIDYNTSYVYDNEPEAVKTECDAEDNESTSSEDDGPGSPGDGNLTELSSAIEFLKTSKALVLLRERFQDFVFPTLRSRLNRLVTKLSTTKRGNPISESCRVHLQQCVSELEFLRAGEVSILYHDDWSILGYLKGATEDATGESWDWWPLKPRMNVLPPNYARLRWICSCGEQRQEDVPAAFATGYERIFRQIPAGTDNSRGSDYALNNLSQSPSINQAGTFLAAGSSQNDGQITSQPPAEDGATDSPRNHGFNITASNTVQQTTNEFIFLGVGADERFHLAQIATQGTQDDYFFEQLRSSYYGTKGILRSWFGLWRYSYCDFSKFEKFDEHEITPRGLEVPDPQNQDYNYNPKPVEHMPPISIHEFRRRFYACSKRHSSLTTRIMCKLHKCRNPCRRSRTALERIPKRKRRVEEDGDSREVFWGIQAIERLSFAVVATYHVFVLAPPLVFWLLWLFYWDHQGDMQNASVPFLTALGILSLFWFPLIHK